MHWLFLNPIYNNSSIDITPSSPKVYYQIFSLTKIEFYIEFPVLAYQSL